MKELTDAGVSKREIKLDIQIAAVAITQHASCIYSNDGEMSKVSRGMIEVKDMPHAHIPELFPPIEVDAPAAPREAAHRVDRSEGGKPDFHCFLVRNLSTTAARLPSPACMG